MNALHSRGDRSATRRASCSCDDDVHADEFSTTVLHGEKMRSMTVSREPINHPGRVEAAKVSARSHDHAATSAGDASRAERSPPAAAKCAANDARRAGGARRAPGSPRRPCATRVGTPAPLPARPDHAAERRLRKDARSSRGTGDAAASRRLAAEINAQKRPGGSRGASEGGARAPLERAREREREASGGRAAEEGEHRATRVQGARPGGGAREQKPRARRPSTEIFVGGRAAVARERPSTAQRHDPAGDGGVAILTTDTDAAAYQQSLKPRYFGLAVRSRRFPPIFAARRSRLATPRRARRLRYLLARARTPGRGLYATFGVRGKSRPPPPVTARVSRKNVMTDALVSAGNALKVAYERDRTTSTPPPVPATPSRDGRDFERVSRGNQARTADDEETRRRAFWEGRAAAERNRRRAMEDEFSGGAGVDVGVSEEGARLLIDPGTGVYGALGADTAPPDDEELVRAKRDAAEEKAAEGDPAAANVSRRRIPARARTRRLRSRSPSPTFARPRRRTNDERLRAHPRTSPRRTRWTSRRVSSFRPSLTSTGN